MSKPVGREEIKVYANVDNEQCVIAAMMRDGIILNELTKTLEPDVFIGNRHKEIFRILRDIGARSLDYDIEVFEQLGKGKDYGTRRYINKLLEAYPEKLKNPEFHVTKLLVDAVKHSLRVGKLQQLIDATENPAAGLDDLSELIQQVNKEITGRLSAGVTRGRNLYEYYLSDVRARLQFSKFIPTGFDWLDESLTEGLARGKISVWTARPSIGKSTLLWNIVYRVASLYGLPTVYFPIEMGTIPVMDGMVSLCSGIHLDKLIKTPHQMTREEAEQVNNAALAITDNEQLAFWNTRIDFNQVYRVISEGRYALAVFDLWEKMVPQKEQAIISEYLDKTQQLAKDTNCHIGIVHQTKRGVEKRPNKRPTLEDLKNSGTYEEVADLVCGLYRDQFYNPDIPEDILEIGILKQRRGARQGWHYYNFEGAYGRVGTERRDWTGADDFE